MGLKLLMLYTVLPIVMKISLYLNCWYPPPVPGLIARIGIGSDVGSRDRKGEMT